MRFALNILWLFLLGAPGICAQPAVKLTVCQLLTDPAPWTGKMIEVRAEVITANDWWVMDEKCPARIRIKGHMFPAGFIFADPSSKTTTGLRVDFLWDRVVLDQLHELDRALVSIRTTKRRVWATVLGVFETRVPIDDLVDERRAFPRRGFGHLGGAAGQILLKSITNIVVEDSK